MSTTTLPLSTIEHAGRTCYQSKMSEDPEAFIRMLIKRGHESVLEHASMTVKFIVDRGVSHELVRHRLASFSQESTRYCRYEDHVQFIIPPWIGIKQGEHDASKFVNITHRLPENDNAWLRSMALAEIAYQDYLKYYKWSPQQARSVLPNSLKTEIVVTANMREWRHILKLRCDKAAHPQMREVMLPLLYELYMRDNNGALFGDIYDIDEAREAWLLICKYQEERDGVEV